MGKYRGEGIQGRRQSPGSYSVKAGGDGCLEGMGNLELTLR